MSDTSKADTKGINLQLDKTFKKGLKIGEKSYLKNWNVGFDSFFGETKEEGTYNANAPTTKEGSLSIGATTSGGTKLGITHSQTKADSNKYSPERKTKSTIFSISKSFKKVEKLKRLILAALLREGQALTRRIESTIREWYNAL